jgi:hypothetical protein
MKKFPVTIVDNFYENPELVRDFALSQKFYPSNGRYPGSRTDLLSDLNKKFFNTFCHKVISLFYDFKTTQLEWNVETTFQKIGKMSKNKESKFNEGWVHYDPHIFSGIIYLSDNSVGTNIYEPIDPDDTHYHQNERDIFYSGENITEEEYSKGIIENNSKFKESIRIDGKFNRLVLFEGGVWHGVPSFYCEGAERLTQVFFFHKMNAIHTPVSVPVADPINYPIIRSKLG